MQEHKLRGAEGKGIEKGKKKNGNYHRKEYAYEKGYGVLRFH